MSTNQPDASLPSQSEQSHSYQHMDTVNPELTSTVVMPEQHTPTAEEQICALIPGSDSGQITAQHSINAEAAILQSANRDYDSTSNDNVEVLSVSHLEHNQAANKSSNMELDFQESSSVDKLNHPLSSTPTCAENTTLSSTVSQTWAVRIPQDNEISTSFTSPIKDSEDGSATSIGNVTQKAENCTSITSSDSDVLHHIDPHIQSINTLCEANASSSSRNENVEPDSSELKQAQSQHQEYQAQETFIGPIKPNELQQYTSPQESMDVDIPTQHSCREKSYDFSNRSIPTFVTWASTEYLRTSSENFLRGCKWSPDGSQLLTNSNDNILRVFNMSGAVLENDNASDIEQISEVLMRESGTVYDYAWIPSMEFHQPDSCRIATTCTGIPIHLWDSSLGKIVSSYKAFDQYDEVTAAYSLSFSASGSQVFGGYQKAIRVFDTEYPGRKCKLIKTCGPKKSWTQPKQTGIISCFAHNLTCEGSFAAGSYTRHIGLYDLRCEGATCVVEGQRGGITQLMFTPDGNMLFSGARKDNEILCWDMRNLGTVCFSALRDVRTNQRMYFDITRSGRYMTSGNDDGTVTFWDLQCQTDMIDGRPYLKPTAQFQAHSDSVNGVSFHPSGDFLATASGQRHFQDFGRMDSSDSDDDDDDDREDGATVKDFSMRVWKMPLSREYAG